MHDHVDADEADEAGTVDLRAPLGSELVGLLLLSGGARRRWQQGRRRALAKHLHTNSSEGGGGRQGWAEGRLNANAAAAQDDGRRQLVLVWR
mmetsp:Transcript_34096/g.67897  ORF Transcript_34096/g.67897 Transcript_34096/m.67897 type:complete len:92 (+) Transcript_34096:150-425(+)